MINPKIIPLLIVKSYYTFATLKVPVVHVIATGLKGNPV
jgi:hypothetical protein